MGIELNSELVFFKFFNSHSNSSRKKNLELEFQFQLDNWNFNYKNQLLNWHNYTSRD